MESTRRLLIGGLASAGMIGKEAALSQEGPTRQPSDLQAIVEAMLTRMMAARHYERVTVPESKALAEWERLRAAKWG